MISRTLIDSINSRNAVSIVGSGISADAGLPTWNQAFQSVADALDQENHITRAARSLARKEHIPEAFAALANLTSPNDIHRRIITLVQQIIAPGAYHKLLADWPFHSHLTTNYDHLLENASRPVLPSVGNRGTELHKVASGNSGYVWHLHGGCDMTDETSHLVVTKADYDDYYPDSNMVTRLRAILAVRQCVFFGFGFKDTDLNHVLQAVGRLAHAGRPSYAFIGYDAQTTEAREHQEYLLTTYNIEVIPYFLHNGSHSDLNRILQSYMPFVERRSISVRRDPHRRPTYSPVASSLSVQSCLDIGATAKSASLKATLIGARVIAHIRESPGGDDRGLESLYRSGNPSRDDIVQCVANLREAGVVTLPPPLELTSEYWTKTEAANAQLLLTKEQFLISLRTRVRERNAAFNESDQCRVADSGAAFLDQLCRERGLGVAQNLATSNVNNATRRAVSLVQHLPERLAECQTDHEASALVHLVADILTSPRREERIFLGRLCQAYFGQHLVGASNVLAKVDLDLISGTCYVLDASVLVCALSEGSEFHPFATNLIRDLTACGAILTTTLLFLEETAEHARWASALVVRHGQESPEIITALRGHGSYTSNEFLRGYYLGEQPDDTFTAYLRRMFEMERRDIITTDIIAKRLSSLNIQSIAFEGWRGFGPEYITRRDRVSRSIEERRLQRGSYKHERQTQAEAEVAIVVDGIRCGDLQPPEATASDAFFLSSTRVVDELPDLQRRICLLPDGLSHWLWSAQSTSPRHADLVFQQLLWELAEGGIEFVDEKTILRRFSGVVEAADRDLKASIGDRRDYLVQKYGPDPAAAFADLNPLDIPRVAEEVRLEALARMEALVQRTRKYAMRAQTEAKLTEKDRIELARLRAAKQERTRKAEGKRLAALRKRRRKGARRK